MTSAMYTIVGTVVSIASVASAALGTKADTVSPGTAPSRRSPGFVTHNRHGTILLQTLQNVPVASLRWLT